MNKRKGFTLIELLVVIAIIAILAAILFPVFTVAKERGRQAQCLSNLKNLGTAFRLYADDNGSKMPSTYMGWSIPVNTPDWCGAVATNNAVVNVDNGAIWRYTSKSKKIYKCPTDKGIPPAYMPTARNYAISYTMNYSLHYYNADSVKRTSRVLLLIHEGRATIDDGCFYWFDDSTKNLPTNIHYDGTTAVYIDGHAKWLSYNQARKEKSESWWDATK